MCSISAAVKYEVPANIVLAVAEKEAGKPGQWVRNTNGTHDVGPMQFNTTYLPTWPGMGSPQRCSVRWLLFVRSGRLAFADASSQRQR